MLTDHVHVTVNPITGCDYVTVGKMHTVITIQAEGGSSRAPSRRVVSFPLHLVRLELTVISFVKESGQHHHGTLSRLLLSCFCHKFRAGGRLEPMEISSFVQTELSKLRF